MDPIQNKKEGFFFLDFRKGIKENEIQDASTIKKRRGVSFFVSFWRHGRVVRRGTANPFSPVQIRVSPDQQKTRNPILCSADIIRRIISQQKVRKELLILA